MPELIIIGGGAAGFFAATELARRNSGWNIRILEKNQKVLQKVKVSGGGRCNVTHHCFRNSELVKRYPRGKPFLKKLFPHFNPENTFKWFQDLGVELHTEEDGRMFPVTNSSQTIMDVFLKQCSLHHVNVFTGYEVLSFEKKNEGFQLELKNKMPIRCDALLITCGGFHKEEQYAWLKSTGHRIVKPIPSLFTFNIQDQLLHERMGISVEQAEVRLVGTSYAETGSVLITHWGLSGPAVLRLSAFAAKEIHDMNYEFQIAINWLGRKEHDLRSDWNTLRNQMGSSVLSSKNPFGLSQRLWLYLLEISHVVGDIRWSELNSKDQNRLIHTLCSQSLSVKGKTTFKEEFVTCGGISLEEVDPHSMQSHLVPGLFFAGEVLDVDGITGGYNFQFAWSSGFVAARGIERFLSS